MLKPWDTLTKIKTNNTIQVIIFDKDLAKEADKLKLSIDNVKDDVLLKQIGDLPLTFYTMIKNIYKAFYLISSMGLTYTCV